MLGAGEADDATELLSRNRRDRRGAPWPAWELGL